MPLTDPPDARTESVRTRTVATDATDAQTDPATARMFFGDYRPGARFTVVSRPLNYKPEIEYPEGEDFLQGLFWNDYGTRIVEYDNTRERVLFFPAKEADVRRGDRYVLGEVLGFEDRLRGLVRVAFDPVE